MKPERPAPIPALTSLRFFAALHVLLFHFAQPQVAGAPEFIRTFIASGNIGVTFFFVLSGFILGYNYLGRTFTARDFLWRRFCRIYPVYFAAILFALPFFAMELRREAFWPDVFRTIAAFSPAKFLMLQAWFEPQALKWNGPSWSLSVEAFFYLLFPALALLFVRLTKVFALLSVVISLALVHVAHIYEPPLPLLSLPLFLLGISLAQMHRFVKPHELLAPIATVALILTIGFMPWIEQNVPMSSAVIAATFGLFVYAFAKESPLARFASHPSLILLGEASYALYILHEPLASLFQAVGARLGGLTMANPILFWTYTLSAIAISIGVYKGFELPIQRRLLARRLKVSPASQEPDMARNR